MHFNRRYELFDLEGEPFIWQCCVIAGCKNMICMGMSDVLCYTHGIAYGIFTEEQFEADRRKRHG